MKFLEDLPIYAHFHRSVEKLKTEENFVVVAPTGTGKSLGLPLKLLKDNLGRENFGCSTKKDSCKKFG